jgi:hypothetical protein
MAGLSGGRALRAGAYGAGNDPVQVGALKCTGGERNLTLCQYALQPKCDHSRDAAVQCTTPPPMPLRLVNGKRTRDYKGRLEVNTVCSVCCCAGVPGGQVHAWYHQLRSLHPGCTWLPIADLSCSINAASWH